MKKFIIILTVIILVSVSIFLLGLNKQQSLKPSLGEQIYTKTVNPLEDKLPETNPFSVETNPAKKAYPNPFD